MANKRSVFKRFCASVVSHFLSEYIKMNLRNHEEEEAQAALFLILGFKPQKAEH